MKKNRINFSSLLLLMYAGFFGVDRVNAMPNINSISDSVIIGTDLGINNLDYRWLPPAMDSFGDNTQPNNTGGWIFNHGNGTNPVTSTTHSHSGDKSLYCNRLSTKYGYNSTLMVDFGTPAINGGYTYSTWWVRYTYSGDGQWKMYRQDYHQSITDAPHDFLWSNWNNGNGRYVMVHTGPGSAGSDYETIWSTPSPRVKDRWYRLEITVKLSSPNKADGIVTTELYDPTTGNHSTVSKTIVTHSSNADLYKYGIWQNYIGNGASRLEVYLDDNFVQKTRARVELCKEGTWATRTHCEIQIPTAWTDNSIIFNQNKGSLADGSTAYIYVVNADGEVNADGYPVTVGASDTNPPTLTQITPIQNPTNDNTPDYTFSSNKAGMIAYGGDCSSDTTSAVSGNNTITLNTLGDGLHSNCTITVTDTAGHISNPLYINTFTINSSPTSSTKADVDLSGSIDIIDALLTFRNSLGLDMTSTNWKASATTGDVNCDGSSNSVDAMLILRDVRGLSMSETGWCVTSD